MEAFHYQHLPKAEQVVYHILKETIINLEESCTVPYAQPDRINQIYFLIRLDCPEIFYTSCIKLRKWPQSDNIEIVVEYLFDKKTIKQQQQAMKARVEKIALQVLSEAELKSKASNNTSQRYRAKQVSEKISQTNIEYQKEVYIHDFICTNIHYDKLKKQYSHEIIGPLGHGVGVCEGIAKAVKVLCDHVGLWCIIVISDSNPEKNIKYRHAWNIVKIGKEYYHLDATFDLTLSKAQIRYDYFNLGDNAIFKDHEAIITNCVPCKSENNSYYQENKMTYTKIEEVKKRALQAAKKEKIFLFQWRGGYLNKEIVKELAETLEEVAKEKEKNVKITLNLAQAVIQAEYQKEKQQNNAEENGIVYEEANEGEKEC